VILHKNSKDIHLLKALFQIEIIEYAFKHIVDGEDNEFGRLIYAIKNGNFYFNVTKTFFFSI
jgi:hypothetical protein